MSWTKEYIYTNNSEKVEAIAPIIVSASRSTDIPAFYAEGNFDVLLNTYPFVYERSDENKKYYIAVNPSKYTHTYKLPSISK
ncbi:MAG: hypothetical protein II220_11545, partial [Spirochaetales bacterium]|nr:hypothetical protein [Spirochaetales bacterium]